MFKLALKLNIYMEIWCLHGASLNNVIWQGKQFYLTFYHYKDPFLVIYPNSKAMFTPIENERESDFTLEWVSYLFSREICF